MNLSDLPDAEQEMKYLHASILTRFMLLELVSQRSSLAQTDVPY